MSTLNAMSYNFMRQFCKRFASTRFRGASLCALRCDLVRLVTDIPEFLPNAEQLNLLQGSANDQTAVLQSSSFQPKHKTAVHAAVHDQSDLRLKKVILNCAANAFKF
ncbi:TPA: hypothetical protein ACH3X2_007675 [Trebouxia sp. C0005]